jgi:hypothetical protein
MSWGGYEKRGKEKGGKYEENIDKVQIMEINECLKI